MLGQRNHILFTVKNDEFIHLILVYIPIFEFEFLDLVSLRFRLDHTNERKLKLFSTRKDLLNINMEELNSLKVKKDRSSLEISCKVILS